MRISVAVIAGLLLACTQKPAPAPAADPAPAPAARPAPLLGPAIQLTLDGGRAGEGYFSADGTQLIFQSERQDDNPFYQIYRMDLTSGDVLRLSPGHGKTTCAWLHPDGQRFLFASTHEDPDARKKQKDELEFRASGKTRRYSWDYDPTFEIYVGDTTRPGDPAAMVNVTRAPGYDAEGSFSPDGTLIAFASNRRAYTEELSDKDAKRLKTDPSFFIDLYVMNADGSDLRRITESDGYDGGPFFSPDGSRITWRRFNEKGTEAEIWTANVDGTDAKQLTQLGAMSWAPYYHPSGDYLIFTTNVHGYSNFELYLVDANGSRAPVRASNVDGFDGLPVFTPDGGSLYWTSNRSGDKGQIFRARWNDARARALLQLPPSDPGASPSSPAAAQSIPRLRADVESLTAPNLEGRLTGTPGERLAAEWLANQFKESGLVPVGERYLQPFDFSAGVRLSDGNALGDLELNQDFRPLAFSSRGAVGEAPVVFVGYGIVAPKIDDQPAYDSYGDADVRGKWAMMFRFRPEEVSEDRRRHLDRFASLRLKAIAARNKGAIGILVVSGPSARVKSQLVPLSSDASQAGSGLAALTVTDGVAGAWLRGRELGALQAELDSGTITPPFELPIKLAANVALEDIAATGHNVIGILKGMDPAAEPVLIGAHFDGQGRGETGNSLAHGDESGGIHPGADDNASGVATMLEIARRMAERPRRRSVIFAGWSGEELGLLGAHAWAGERLGEPGKAKRTLAAVLNLDMVGRLDDVLVLNGTGSAREWAAWIEQVNATVGAPVRLRPSSYLPTDATAFYVRGVPILSAFTGGHGEYHTPRDTSDRLNYAGMDTVASVLEGVAERIAALDVPPDYVESKAPESGQGRRRFRVYLGTIPDYTQEGENGVKLTGVKPGTPAEAAGLRGGDVIVELAGKPIQTIYDYVYSLESLRPNEATTVIVLREGRRVTLDITPGARE